MSNIEYKKKTPFGILIATSVLLLITILATIGITGAWFTDNKTPSKSSNTPFVLTAFDSETGTKLEQVITLTTSTKVNVKVDANIDVYMRAKVIVQFYDSSNNIITGLTSSNYYTITYKSGWVEDPSGYEENFLYYNLSNTVATGSTTSAIVTELITNVERTATALPDYVSSVKLQMWAESIQGNADGLAKWQTA